MAYSIQTAVSDGTLEVLDLSIKYMDKSHIFVYVDDVLVDGSAYSYVWLTDTRIQIVPAVANGSTVKVIRKTLTDEMWHEFSKGARFSTTSMDENFEQLLFLAQEYSEGIYVSDFYKDVDMHLKRIRNLGDPINDGDAVNLKTLKVYLPNADLIPPLVERIAAEEAKSVELGKQGITLSNKTIIGFDATGLQNNAWVHFAGRDTVGDGGGGPFRYSASSTQTADGIFVFAPTGGGRLFREGWTVFGFNGDINVRWAGAKADGVTNDSPAFSTAILACALQGGGRVIAPSSQYKLLGTIIIPSNVELDLCNSEITGPGIGSATDLFRSGYLSSGSLVTNIGTPLNSHLVTKCSVKNGTIKNCGKAFNLYNFLWNSSVESIVFYDCTYAVFSDSCYYSRFVNLISLLDAGGATNAAFHFQNFVNVQGLESIFVSGRKLGIEIKAGANGATLFNCGAEGCIDGIKISEETGPVKLDTCYLEHNTGTGVDFSQGGTKYSVTIDNCWFAFNGKGINVGDNSSYIDIKANNRYLDNTVDIDSSGEFNTFSSVALPVMTGADNMVPTIPSKVLLGGKSRVDAEALIFAGGTGRAAIKTKVSGNTLIAFHHEGYAGDPVGNTVPFCTLSKSEGTTFSVYIDTKIAWSPYSSLCAYRLTVTDAGGPNDIWGFVFGDKVSEMDSVGYTVTASNNGGFLRLTISTLSHPTGFYAVRGIVRHM